MAKIADEPSIQEAWYFRTYTYASEYQRTLLDLSLTEKALLNNYTQLSLKYGGVKSSMSREAIIKALSISLSTFNRARSKLVALGYITSDQEGHRGLASVTLTEKAFHTSFRGKAYNDALKGSQDYRKHDTPIDESPPKAVENAKTTIEKPLVNGHGHYLPPKGENPFSSFKN